MKRALNTFCFGNFPYLLSASISLAIGIALGLRMFDLAFVLGEGPFWQFPHGTIPGSQDDSASALTGYLYYAQAPWHVPLFYVAKLGIPSGTSIFLTDSAPLVALAGKIVSSLTGTIANPYGVFVFLCCCLPGVMMTTVNYAAGVRGLAGTITASVFADTLPALLWQWGHMALGAHFLIIGGFGLYAVSLGAWDWRRVRAVWIVYLVICACVNLYIVTMVCGIWACAVLQRWSSGTDTLKSAISYGLTAAVAVVAAMWILGGVGGPASALPFSSMGPYSMNLASPFMPQMSGIFRDAREIIDATGGQYEGYNYLGAGFLLMSLACLPMEIAWFRANATRHAWLIATLVLATVFALSNEIYFGKTLLLGIPVSPLVFTAGGLFRSSGRFFWLVSYAQIALLLALVFRRESVALAVVALFMSLVQIVDVEPLRQNIAASVSGPGTVPLDQTRVENLIHTAERALVSPSYECATEGWQRHAAVQLQLAAARENMPTNTPYLGRYSHGMTLSGLLLHFYRTGRLTGPDIGSEPYCEGEPDRIKALIKPGTVLFLLPARNAQAVMTGEGMTCGRLEPATYCATGK